MFLCLRLENVEGEWYIQYAEASVLQEFPRERIFFEKSFRVPKVVPKVGSKEYDCCLLKVILPFLTTH